MEDLAVFLLFLFTVRLSCSPVDQFNSDRNSRSLDLGDQTILDNIIKVNKDNDVNIYEGDIELSPDDAVDIRDAGDVDGEQMIRRKRNAARDRKRLWVKRVVPYQYASDFPDSYKPTVQEAITEYENRTCLKFVQRTSEDLFVLFVHKSGCWSPVGRQYWMTGVGQQLSLGNGCNHKGTILHEIMHALGFWHEQSRPDRNLYVEVLWENIEQNHEHNFNKYSHHDIDRLKIPYDLDSIMHYGRKSFSKNGKDTIRSILNHDRPLGQRDGLTDFDVHEVNALYDCSSKPGWSRWSNFGPCSLRCYKSRQRFCSSSNRIKDCPEADSYGVQEETAKCNNSECYAPIDGHWGRWSQWGACDAKCGFGKHHRTRLCDDPQPKYGGKGCNGNLKESKACKLKSCGMGPDDCEFDISMCYWGNDKINPSDFNWMRHTGATPSSSTGPYKDHTTGTGYYVYAETSGIDQNKKARLLSRTFPSTNGRCMSFWYHMYGSGMGQLNVYIKPAKGVATKIWSLSGDQGNEWRMKQITLTSSASEYKVAFEAVRGSSFRSDIALDDISFEESPCLEAIGCFRDERSRALPDLVTNLRGKIDWSHMDRTVASCAKAVQAKGYKYFGLQFYGECWSGGIVYDKYGVSPPDSCWKGVGKKWANFVYKII